MQEQVFTIQEVAEKLRVHHITIRRMIDKGEIAAFKMGYHWRIKASEVERLTQKKHL